jgi:hypothetical protein
VNQLAWLAAKHGARGGGDETLDRWLADPTEPEACDRDTELRDRQVAIEPRNDLARSPNAHVFAWQFLRVSERRANLDERKFDRDEQAIERDENNREKNADHVANRDSIMIALASMAALDSNAV